MAFLNLIFGSPACLADQLRASGVTVNVLKKISLAGGLQSLLESIKE